MATLSVQEAMGLKVDREAVATLVLPQLWAMSIGPCRLDFRFVSTFF
jgi:SCY1-like protein 2